MPCPVPMVHRAPPGCYAPPHRRASQTAIRSQPSRSQRSLRPMVDHIVTEVQATITTSTTRGHAAGHRSDVSPMSSQQACRRQLPDGRAQVRHWQGSNARADATAWRLTWCLGKRVRQNDRFPERFSSWQGPLDFSTVVSHPYVRKTGCAFYRKIQREYQTPKECYEGRLCPGQYPRPTLGLAAGCPAQGGLSA